MKYTSQPTPHLTQLSIPTDTAGKVRI